MRACSYRLRSRRNSGAKRTHRFKSSADGAELPANGAGLDDQYRASSVADDLFRDIADEQPFDARAAVRRKDDQVGTPLRGGVENGLQSIPALDEISHLGKP